MIWLVLLAQLAGAQEPMPMGPEALPTGLEALNAKISDDPLVALEAPGVVETTGVEIGASSPEIPWSPTWPILLGLMGVGGLAMTARNRFMPVPASSDGPPWKVLGETTLPGNARVVMLDVRDAGGQWRRLLVSTGGGRAELVTDLGPAMDVADQAISVAERRVPADLEGLLPATPDVVPAEATLPPSYGETFGEQLAAEVSEASPFDVDEEDVVSISAASRARLAARQSPSEQERRQFQRELKARRLARLKEHQARISSSSIPQGSDVEGSDELMATPASGVAALARAHDGGTTSGHSDTDLRGTPVLGAELARRLAAASGREAAPAPMAPRADRAEFAAGLRPEDGSHRSVEEARDLIRGLMASRADAAGDDR